MNSNVAFAPMCAMNNRKQIQASETAGCYHCLTVFSAKEVIAFTDEGKTAVCPKCGHDCVLPSSQNYHLDEKLLKEIHDYWL